MKKFISLIVIMLVASIGLQAQTKTKSFTTKGGFMEYVTTTAMKDSVSLGETSTYTVLNDCLASHFYNQQFKFTSVSTTQGTIVLKGKYFSSDTPTTITTVYVNTAADSVINFQQITTRQNYRYYQVIVTPAGSGSQIFTKWLKVSHKQ